jgi:hypothetical protein
VSVAGGNRFRQLDDAQILGTLSRLRDRITERFPGSGLAGVADELLALGHETAARVAYLRRPQWLIRGAAGLGIAAMALVLVVIARTFQLPTGVDGLDELVQASDAAITDTASSPVRSLTPMELGRYLDSCSELLSLISKIAALHVQQFNEPVVLGAVNEIETLSTGLSGKIWQKISLLNAAQARAE